MHCPFYIIICAAAEQQRAARQNLKERARTMGGQRVRQRIIADNFVL